MRFEVLGPVRAVRGGQPAGPISELRRRLLAVLLVRANRSVSSDVIARVLWGSAVPERPGNSLHIHVHRLRQVLDRPDRLLATPGGYQLNLAPDELDALVFDRLHAEARQALADGGDRAEAAAQLREALALWRGAPYAGVDEHEVITPEAKRLAEARLVAYEELFDTELSRGRAREVVPELTELVAEYPLRERFAGQLMLALYRSGRRPRAEAAYHAVRQRLARQLKSQPGRELRELHDAIRAEDPELDLPASGSRPARSQDEPARPRRPALLPPAPGAFFGRETELAELERIASQASDDGSGGLVLLTGMAGIGKTGLAVRYAHSVAARFPDGQLYLDLRGHSPGPALDPLTALGQLLRALGADPNRVWESEADAAAEYRSLLSGRHLLVLLDNAASADQVRPLLPATPGCLTLVTSRNRLSGLIAREGAHRIGIGELPPAVSHTLLERLAGKERLANEQQAAATLIEACAGLPLALRLAAAQLADEPHRPLADYLAELRDRGLATFVLEDDEHSAVAAAFDLSYQHLAPANRRLFRLLGLVPGNDFTAGAAAALSGSPAAEARAVLRALAGVHLLEEHADGRYRFHDLVRDYARHHAESAETEAERDEALERLFAWYYQGKRAAVAHRSSIRRHPPAPALPAGIPGTAVVDGEAAIGWLCAEFPNLAAAVHAVVDRPGQAHWSWHLTVGLVVAMAEQGYASEVHAMAETAADAARKAGDRHALANALTELAAGLHRSDLPVNVALMAEALEHAEQVGDRALLGYCLNVAAVVHKTKGDLEVAERYLTRSLELQSADGDQSGQARALDNLALIAYQRGDLRRTERLYEQIVALSGDQATRLTALGLPGLIWARVMLGRVDGIDDLIASAEEVTARFGHRIKQHLLRLYRAIWYRDTGRFAEAYEQASAAVRSADELDQPLARGDARYQLGSCQLLDGDLAAARATFERARELATSTQVAGCLAPALRGLAETELAAGRLELAESLAARAIEYAEERPWSPVQVAGATVTLARVELALGRPEAAVAHGRRALAIHQETGHFLGLARAHRVLGEATVGAEGVEHLREALRRFEAYGSPEAADVRTRLARPARSAPSAGSARPARSDE
ncbi:AfsR/SARP family transcriptional regulator [Flindersiella endophytica]